MAAQQGFDPRPPDRRRPASWDDQPVWQEESFEEPPLVAAPPVAPRAIYPGRARRRARRSTGCLLAFGILSILLVGGLVMLLLAGTMVVQPMIRDAAVAEIRTNLRGEMERQIDAQIGDSQRGELVISQDEINDRLSGGADLGPISGATVEISPDGLLVRLRAYGVDGTYRARVVDQDGSVAIIGTPMEGPLAYIMPEGDLERAVNEELAAAISQAGYYVEQVATAEGAITLTLAQ